MVPVPFQERRRVLDVKVLELRGGRVGVCVWVGGSGVGGGGGWGDLLLEVNLLEGSAVARLRGS